MNETATATSTSSTSSAAAVADSANTVATTKTSSNSVTASVAASGNALATAPTSAMSSTAKATSVKLLIKASNQQYDDQILDIDLLWTVKRLKAHLAQVYPNKPPVDEQKLIYSGQLLNDNLLLKDVIRSYKDVYTQNHIIHLVYTPKNSLNANFKQKSKSNTTNAASSMSPSGNSTDGLRQRHAAGSNSSTAQANYQQQQYYQQYQQQSNFTYTPFNQQQLQNQQCPLYDPNNPQYATPFGFPGQLNMQAMANQQAAMYNWMQQVYSQYMEQCIRMSNTSATSANGIPNIFTTNAASNTTTNNLPQSPGVSPFGYNPFLQQLPFIASTATAPGVATNNPVIPTATMLSQPVAGSPADTNTAVQAAAGEQAQAQPDRQAAAAPRFPNIVQEEQENRDWLDSFFSITRLAIFLTILYLNSSPMRCLAVVIIAGGIYLYHIGVLRIRNERNNNNINRNNNAADADQIRRGVRQVQQAAHAEDQRNPQNAADADAAAAAAVDGQPSAVNAGEGTATVAATEANENTNNTASVISVLRTFVITFFTSLLPETPTL